MNDWGVIGHDWAVKRLAGAIARSQLAQSHLFVGPPSIGKAALARATARALLGSDARGVALVESGRHPDLTWISPEGDSIKVEVIRDLLHQLMLAPVESQYRVAVIDQAQLMTDGAKNALLKTLEEPNRSVVMILIAPSAESVLPTIVSRCQVLNLRAAPMTQIRAALVMRGVPSERAAFLARLSRGRAGRALAAVADEGLLEKRAERLADFRALLAADAGGRFAFAEKLARKDGAVIQETLDDWQLIWRDVCQISAGASPDHMHNADAADLLSQLAGQATLKQARDLMRGVGETGRQIEQNVNARLALDVLLLKMPRLG